MRLSLEDAIPSGLGPAIRYLREQRGLTQVELARRAGIGKSQLSLYEHSKRAPSYGTLQGLLEALHFDFHDLHNALKIAEGKFDEVCAGRGQEKEAAVEKIAEGLNLLLRLAGRSFRD
jgi:transcriptional regulator with XRE-family HTH domain